MKLLCNLNGRVDSIAATQISMKISKVIALTGRTTALGVILATSIERIDWHEQKIK
jgi:hypothetical protein